MLPEQLLHGDPVPRWFGQAWWSDAAQPGNRMLERRNKALHILHQVLDRSTRPIPLQHGKFGIVPLARLQPPEAAADLVDARKTAHEHPLHLEFGRGDQKSGRLGCAFDRDGKGLELRLRVGCRHE